MTNLKNIMNEIFITKYYIIMGWNWYYSQLCPCCGVRYINPLSCARDNTNSSMWEKRRVACRWVASGRELSINRWPAGDNMFQLSENLDCSTNSDDIQYPIWMQCWNVADSFWEQPFELTSTKNIGHARRYIWCYMYNAGSTPVSFIRNIVVVAIVLSEGNTSPS